MLTVWVTMWLVSVRGLLPLLRPGGSGSHLCPGLPPWDPGSAVGGHWKPVCRSTLLLWNNHIQGQPSRPLHPGKGQQLSPIWQRCLWCRLEYYLLCGAAPWWLNSTIHPTSDLSQWAYILFLWRLWVFLFLRGSFLFLFVFFCLNFSTCSELINI